MSATNTLPVTADWLRSTGMECDATQTMFWPPAGKGVVLVELVILEDGDPFWQVTATGQTTPGRLWRFNGEVTNRRAVELVCELAGFTLGEPTVPLALYLP